MSLQLFRIQGGLSDGNVHYLSANGAPGGDASFQDAAPIGSKCSDYTNGEEYIKIAAGAGADKWRRQASLQDLGDLVAGSSWREPALVYDTVHATTGDAITDLNADDQIQGVTVTAGDRILLAGIPTSPNVYIIGGSTGAWTLTEDTNEETAGDTLRVLSGDNADKTYWFNGTNWIWIDKSTDDEIGFVRAFIGKGASGSVMPSYASNNYVVDGDDLALSISNLDAQVKVNTDGLAATNTNLTNLTTTVTDLQTEVDNIEAAVGLNGDGTYAAPVGTNYLDASTDVMNALSLLDTAVAESEGDVVGSTISNVTTQTALDNVLVDDVKTAKWFIHVQEVATPTNVYAFELYATHNGTTTSDATDADYSIANIIRMGQKISGLDIDAAVSGTGAAQEMRVLVTSTDAVDVTAIRLTI